MTVGIRYADGPRLARSLFAAADWVAAGREEVNRINVFPVPGGDTGTNPSLTLRAAGDSPGISILITRKLQEGEVALVHTPDLLAGLKEAAPAAPADVAAEREFRCCTEVMIKGDQLPPAGDVRSQIRGFGGSVQVMGAADLLKIHVHTDTPDAVLTFAVRWGTVETRNAEDMPAQHRMLGHQQHRAVAIVVDSSVDLPDAVLDRHHMLVVPPQVMFGDQTFRDRAELRPEDFYRKMRVSREHPTGA